jgi:ribosome biogenesis GTPase A
LSINWFPGHMVKARREIKENIKLVDIVVILLDARAPFSCRNIDLEKMVASKKVMFVLNKMDLASPEATRKYLANLREQGINAAAMDSTSGQGITEVLKEIKNLYHSQAEDMKAKGRRVRAARIMVVGVPNIGKSTFINCLAGRKVAATGAKPGITRGKQWIRVREDIELMDTPGLMWPKVERPDQGLKLALLSIVGEKSYEEYEVVLYFLRFLKQEYPQILANKLRVSSSEADPEEILSEIARRRGHLVKGGELDLSKTCTAIIQDFRKGKLGSISLD